jgi:hypothetical protein
MSDGEIEMKTNKSIFCPSQRYIQTLEQLNNQCLQFPSVDWNYMFKTQKNEINFGMRVILIDWLISVANKLRHRVRTIFLTVEILDRYLSVVPITRPNLQLVGAAAIWIAAKCEEIYFCSGRDLVAFADKCFTLSDLLQMERNILTTLSFNTVYSTSWDYAQLFLTGLPRSYQTSEMELRIAYLLQASLLQRSALLFKPICLAAAACFIAIQAKKKPPEEKEKEKASPVKPGNPACIDVPNALLFMSSMTNYSENVLALEREEILKNHHFLFNTKCDSLRAICTGPKWKNVALLNFD